jgi:hypothetical protein
MKLAENIQANWEEGYYFVMTTSDPIQPGENSRTAVGAY